MEVINYCKEKFVYFFSEMKLKLTETKTKIVHTFNRNLSYSNIRGFTYLGFHI
jgi:hypothetical protein